MIFSDRDLRALIDAGTIKIDPLPNYNQQLGSVSIDLRLGTEFRVFKIGDDTPIDIHDPQQVSNATEAVSLAIDEPFILQPQAFAIAVTHEYVELPDDIVARLEGRSSLGRLGIIVHATASVIDPGWRGNIALELANHGARPIALYPLTRICALTFEKLSSPAEIPYWRKSSAKYVNQRGPEESHISTDEENRVASDEGATS